MTSGGPGMDAPVGAPSRDGRGPAGDWPWDGRVHAYRPSPDWRERLSARLRLHDDVAPDLDPVTYEVVRHRLWATNLAHGETITRISGSPIFQVLDFNMCITTELGETVLDAPYEQFLDSGCPLMIHYVMEHLGEDPGIEPGDAFLSNDPWIGAFHQMDVFIGCPVFVDDRLFAWVANAGHQYDLGGVTPGGWPQNALDIFHDPAVIPPVKIVEHGRIRPDLEAAYLRTSRVPDIVALDLRAQLAGCRFAADQLLQACDEFGPETVKAVMHRILDSAETALRERLARIPDGRWTQVHYLGEPMPGERRTQRAQVNLIKTADRLVVDNAGTDPQEPGPNGFTFTGFSGVVTGAISVSLLYEQLFAVGGAARSIDYRPEPGLVTCVDHPAAVSGGAPNAVSHFHAVITALAQMMITVPDLADNAMAASADDVVMVVEGVSDTGHPFGSALLDAIAKGSGARSGRDGVDTGGDPHCPLMRCPNVEEVEQFYPLLYLYRDQVPDGGGAGKWRGGGGLRSAFTPYRARWLAVQTNTGGLAASVLGTSGLMGGYPAPTTRTMVLAGTDLARQLAAGWVPSGLDDIAASSRRVLAGKTNAVRISPGDVVEVRFGGGAGYGDPIEREPERVASDVADGWVSRVTAGEVYAVAIRESGTVDDEDTARLRREERARRMQWRPCADEPRGPLDRASEPFTAAHTPSHGKAVPVHESLAATGSGGRLVLSCTRCGALVSDYAENYKRGLLLHHDPVTVVPLVDDPSAFLDDSFELRRFCCPGCATLLAVDVARADEPIVPDMLLEPADPGAVQWSGDVPDQLQCMPGQDHGLRAE